MKKHGGIGKKAEQIYRQGALEAGTPINQQIAKQSQATLLFSSMAAIWVTLLLWRRTGAVKGMPDSPNAAGHPRCAFYRWVYFDRPCTFFFFFFSAPGGGKTKEGLIRIRPTFTSWAWASQKNETNPNLRKGEFFSGVPSTGPEISFTREEIRQRLPRLGGGGTTPQMPRASRRGDHSEVGHWRERETAAMRKWILKRFRPPHVGERK